MDDIRLFLHVLSASVWVGGLIVLAGLVPTVRTFGEDAPKKVAQAFNRIAWPAFAVAVLTGIWNILAVGPDDLQHPAMELKVFAVLLSGVGAAIHQTANGNKARLAAGGAASAVFAVIAMYLGVVLG
jgi:putative copper export protein